MTPNFIWMVATALLSGVFSAGGAFGAIAWRFRALEQRIGRLEEDIDRAESRIDRLLLRKRHAD